MPTETVGEVPDVPRPVVVFLEAAYIILLTLGILASVSTVCCLLWRFFGNRSRKAPSVTSQEASSDKETQRDEDSDEECAGLEFWNDTDEEYMRRPY